MQLSVPRQGIIKLQAYQTDHHSIFPFICAIWSTHFIPQGQGCLKGAGVHVSEQGNYAMPSSPKRKRALTPGHPKTSIKTQTEFCVSLSSGVDTTFEEKKKESDPQIFAIAGLHFAF